MLKFDSFSNQLLLSTIKIKTRVGEGTGFFFTFKYENGDEVPILITNKHVINNKKLEEVVLIFHTCNNEGISEKNIGVPLQLEWVHHPKYDLCFTPVASIINYYKMLFKEEIIFKTFMENNILDTVSLGELNALEEVAMVGYPIGLHDEKNNFPIFRKGYTSSHPALSFNEEGIGLVDMACFPGSSGSPIFILNEGSYTNSTGIVVGHRFIFLGVLFAGPLCNVTGKIKMKEIDLKMVPISETSIMTNLGYYIQAKVILDFKDMIREIITKSKENQENNSQHQGE